jgi:hypothetical protein
MITNARRLHAGDVTANSITVAFYKRGGLENDSNNIPFSIIISLKFL